MGCDMVVAWYQGEYQSLCLTCNTQATSQKHTLTWPNQHEAIQALITQSQIRPNRIIPVFPWTGWKKVGWVGKIWLKWSKKWWFWLVFEPEGQKSYKFLNKNPWVGGLAETQVLLYLALTQTGPATQEAMHVTQEILGLSYSATNKDIAKHRYWLFLYHHLSQLIRVLRM